MKKAMVVFASAIWLGTCAAQAELIAHWKLDGNLGNAIGEKFELKTSGWSEPVYSDDARGGGQSVHFGNPPAGGPNTVTDRLWASGGTDLGMGSGSWSFAAWIKPDEDVLSGAMTIFSAEGTDTKYKLYCDIREKNTMDLFFKNDSNPSLVPDKMVSGFWAHSGNWSLLAVVFDSTAGTISIYRYSDETSPKDIQAEGVVLRKQMNSKFDITIKSFSLGYSAGNKNGFSGLMDDVRIYNHALSEQEIVGLVEGK